MSKGKNYISFLVVCIKKLPVYITLGIITVYRKVISPIFPSSCRFIPTCSEYGLIAFQRFGFCKGFLLTLKRIIKCRPGGPYGYDPVPEIYPDKTI